MSAGLGALRRPIRTVLRWQLVGTAVAAVVAAALAGSEGALSAVLGGAVSLCAGGAAAMVAALGRARSAGGVLIGALTAEGVKIGLIALLLWLVLATYEGVVLGAFFGTFFATILIFGMAFFVREYD